MRPWIDTGLGPADQRRLGRLLAGGDDPEAVVVLDRPLRRVIRVALERGTVYVKQNRFPRFGTRLRYALRASPTQKELGLLRRCRDRDIVVPEPLGEATARSLFGPVRACLATLALPEGRAPSPAEHCALADRLAALGLYHPDLHGDNLRVLDGDRPAVLDLQSCRLFAGPVPARHRTTMRAKVVHELCTRIGDRELRSVVAEVFGAAAVDGLLDRARILERRRLASRARHLDRASSKVEVSRRGLCGRRLWRRGTAFPGPFGAEQVLDLGPLGSGTVARDAQERVRLRAAADLHRLWIAAMLHLEAGRQPLPVVAWEREPSLWPRRECLYIEGPIPDRELLDRLLLLLSGP